MKSTVLAAVFTVIAGGSVLAQDQKPESFLIVELAQNAQIAGDVLTLGGIDGSVLAFSDRPYRDTKTLSLSDMMENWSKGSDDLASDPPNAALTGVVDGAEVGLVLELSEPKHENDTLSFTVKQLAGPEVGEMQNAALIIDDICITGTSYCLMTGNWSDIGG